MVEIGFEEGFKKANKYAVSLLSKRNYHSISFRKKLKEKRFSEEVIEAILKKFANFFDDEDWMKRKVLGEFAKGYGPKMIIAKLRCKNIFVENEISLITDDMQKEKILEILNKKFPDRTDKNKAFSYLVRKGFDYSLIKQCF